jgi:predicted lipid-binding transport protein (Tim44 family)
MDPFPALQSPQANRELPVVFEIVILAMIAAFLGLRLYSVLGRRAEHEEEIVPVGSSAGDGCQAPAARRARCRRHRARERQITGFPPAVERGLRDIAAADRRFDLIAFLEGARGAYQMVLEAFWRGDRENWRTVRRDVYDGFVAAIDEREAGRPDARQPPDPDRGQHDPFGPAGWQRGAHRGAASWPISPPSPATRTAL